MEPQLDHDEDFKEIADLRGGPGILILSTDMRLQHMNRRGWEFIRLINEEQAAKDAGGLLPVQVSQICAEIEKLLRGQADAKDWEQLEVRRLTGSGQARIMILLEAVGRRERVVQEVHKRFQFTDREKNVVESLAKGLTNKEIAAELGITEPTVKAHIKHIMDKTKCATRTAIVAQLFQS
jgi:two-component system, NarL family, nitrate/nitrite response regulator NarL